MVENKCSVCLQSASQRCAGCQIIYYCCKDHQKQDWKKHKGTCRPFTICEDKLLGRHLVASRDIKLGEIVLCEKPLVRGPSQITGPVCLGCLAFISAETSQECPDCGWPVCIEGNCHKSLDHKPECTWTLERRKNKVRISQFLSPHPSYECITPLRICYQRDKNPQLWSKLLSLESHCSARHNTPKQLADAKSIAQFLHRFYNLEKDFTIEEILKICGIIEVNGHEVPVTEPPYVAIYSLASMLEHDCHSNCSKSFNPNGDLIIHAAVPIKKGEHLSICYTDALWSSGSRRQHLLETKYFSCRCDRCIDPTEFNTYFSAVKCLKSDCGGAVLPPSFCDGGTVEWICGKCDTSREWSDIKDMLDRVGLDIHHLEREDTKACRRFLNKWSSALHPNHFYMTDVGLSLAQQYGQENGINTISDEDLQHKIQICQQLLELLNILAPGECRIRGVLAYELHASTAEIVRRSSSLTPPEIVQLLMESKEYLVKAMFCLSNEPDSMPEGKLYKEGKKSLVQLENILKSLANSQAQILCL